MLNYGHFVTMAVRRATPPRQRRRRRDVIGVIWPYVSVAEIEKLNAKMLQLGNDIEKYRVPVPDDPTKMGDWWNRQSKWSAYKWKWTSFSAEWNAWDVDHYGELARTGNETRQEFDGFRGGYNEWLRSFKADWTGETDAQELESEADKPGPLDKLTESISMASLAVLGVLGFYAYKQLNKD